MSTKFIIETRIFIGENFDFLHLYKWFPNFGREKYFYMHPHKETLRQSLKRRLAEKQR